MHRQNEAVALMNPRDFEDEEWIEDEEDNQDDVLVCPVCRGAVHQDAQQCPHCGDWITPVYPEVNWKRWAWIVAVVIVLASFLLTAAF